MRRKEGPNLFPKLAANENNHPISVIVKPYFGIRVINTFRVDRSPSAAKAEAYRVGAEVWEAPSALALESRPRGHQALGNYRLILNGAQI
jgi:hypothetical protein